MREEQSAAHAKALFVKALEGQNFSPRTVRAYQDDLAQFTTWLQTIRVGAEPCTHKRGQPRGSGLGQRRWPVERSNA